MICCSNNPFSEGSLVHKDSPFDGIYVDIFQLKLTQSGALIPLCGDVEGLSES